MIDDLAKGDRLEGAFDLNRLRKSGVDLVAEAFPPPFMVQADDHDPKLAVVTLTITAASKVAIPPKSGAVPPSVREEIARLAIVELNGVLANAVRAGEIGGIRIR